VALRIFNTITGQKAPFEPLVAGKVGLYVCGPTVQDRSHVGHARVYTAFDVVVRWLRAKGLAVTHVRNFTDIDDKIIRKAAELGITPDALAEKNIALFWSEMDELGIGRPDVAPRVTTHIPEIIALIETLIARGAAYESQGDVYFAVKKYPPYGKLSKRNLDDLLSGARVESGEQKHDPLDFALWKAAKPGEPSWDSPWGKGRPGWHIECSAMAAKYLGQTFDLHAGGKDLVFPHHENELAQSEAASGVTFSRGWMHNGFVTLDQEKMSKSLGNFFTLREILDRFSAEAVRTFLLSTHYRNPIDFSDTALMQVEKRVDYFYETLAKLDERLAVGKEPGPGVATEAERLAGIAARFNDALDDDFNTAEGLAIAGELFAIVNELLDGKGKTTDKAAIRRGLAQAHTEIARTGSILGLWQRPAAASVRERQRVRAQEKGIDIAAVEAAIVERNDARKAKDFARADAVRDRLKALGVEIMDTAGGTSWKVL
jgi:cysteinyl-tRNA synthetase